MVHVRCGTCDRECLCQLRHHWHRGLRPFVTPVIPVAAGIAILKHRLYDIDVIINRSLVYGSLTAMLGLAYVLCVFVFGLLLSPVTEDSGIAVAASTLAVAALFRPGRARIQRLIDRRFFRRKYDAERILEAFSISVRNDVDLEAITGELLVVVEEAMTPAHATLWLRNPDVLSVKTWGSQSKRATPRNARVILRQDA